MSSEELLSEASLESLNSLVSTISDCSELAIRAVSNYLEDQIADPEQVEKNLARVKSVFSMRNLFGFGGDGGGDARGVYHDEKQEKKTLLSLPPKIRQHIWSYLDDKAIKTLRYVCEHLRFEMDYDVGLAVVLREDSFTNLWMRSLSIRSCVIKQMESMLVLNKFCRPEKLERLSFDPDLKLDPDMIELIIRKFRNIQQLIIYTEDVVVIKNNVEDGVHHPNSSSKIMSRLEDQFRLTSVDVKFDTSKWKLKWNIRMKPQKLQKYTEVRDVIGAFGMSGIAPVPQTQNLGTRTLRQATISIPFVQEKDRFMWLKILQFQCVLSSITCDLNATHWRDYEKIVRGNQRTLRKLFLLNVTDSSKRCLLSEPPSQEDLPFDWKMFEYCGVLEEITLIAETFVHSSATKVSMMSERGDEVPRKYIASENLTTLSCPRLRAIWLENFKFEDEEVQFLKYSEFFGVRSQAPREKAQPMPRFEICTLKNCKLGDEVVTEAHLGLRKERNRSLECLCFGTLVYDDDDLENFEKYTAEKLAEEENLAKNRAMRFPIDDLDMIEAFRLAGRSEEDQESKEGHWISENVNLIGGIAFTTWLYFC